MFRIKICGITNPEDAQSVIRAGADALGLNFYASSPRCTSLAAARRICRILPAETVKVGVFVNAQAKDVCQTCDELPLDLIQLHGDETPEYLAQLGPRAIMRAFRLGPEGLSPVLAYLAECKQLGCMPKLVLLDAFRQGIYGGTGTNADWSVCAEYRCREGVPPLVLAGGLNQSNVADAIARVRPAAVDTAGGVESGPGRKDPAAVLSFVQAALKAFAINDCV